MTIPTRLNKVHCQRIGVAVRTMLAGKEIRMSVENNGSFGCALGWREAGVSKWHVIATGGVNVMRQLLPVARAELNRLVAESAQAA